MSNDLNLCQFIGRLGSDPDVKHLDSGTIVANFSIAVGHKYKDTETTEWVRVTAFGKLAEIVERFCVKGKQIYVQGRMQTRSWEKDGVKRFSTEIIADRIQLLGSKSDRPASSHEPDSGEPFSDGIPF